MQTKVFTDFSGGCLNLVEIDSMKHINILYQDLPSTYHFKGLNWNYHEQWQVVKFEVSQADRNLKERNVWSFYQNLNQVCTGKSLSEALIFASTNPKYDDRLFIELRVQ